MTRKPRQSRSARRVVRNAPRIARNTVKTAKRDPLDDVIDAGARLLGLKIDKTWMAAVRGHLKVTLRHGASVAAFVVPDDTEPAPVFEA
jgi:hypothetical protein